MCLLSTFQRARLRKLIEASNAAIVFVTAMTQHIARILFDATTRVTAISPEELRGRSRPNRIAIPRQALMIVARERFHLTHEQIGKMLNRDHSTVVQAQHKRDDPLIAETVKKINAWLDADRAQLVALDPAADWIHVTANGEGLRILCTRCGHSNAFTLPVGAKEMTMQVEVFAQSHQCCPTNGGILSC